jgi:hypothetical protein
MNRFVALLDSDGYQAGLQLTSNPEETNRRIKEINSVDYNDKIKIIYLFEEEKDPRKVSDSEMRNYIKTYKSNLINKIAREDNSDTLSSYAGYDLRKRFTNGSNQIEAFYALTKSNHDLLMRGNPYEVAFHILDLCIMGRTRLNRFNNKKEILITGTNLTKNFENKKKDFKTLRKLMMNNLQNEEDDDEI